MRIAIFMYLFALLGSLRADGPLRVEAYDEAGREIHSGQGVALDAKGYIATARSLLVGARRVSVVAPDGTALPVFWVAAEDPGAGLVKLWVAGAAGEAPVFSKTAPEAKSTLLVDGKPVVVRKVRDVPGSGVVAELNSTADYSLSGSPILDEQHQVAGFLVPQFLGTRTIAFCVPVSHIFEMGTQPLVTVEEWSAKHDRNSEEAYQLALGQIWGEYYDNAARNLEEAVMAKRDFAEAWFHLGFAHAKLGHVDEKIRYYRRAIALKPDYAEAHFSLGISYLLQGKRSEAQQEVEALKKIPATSLADRLTKLIESIHIDAMGVVHTDEVI